MPLEELELNEVVVERERDDVTLLDNDDATTTSTTTTETEAETPPDAYCCRFLSDSGCLVFSYALSSWGFRLWDFAVPILFLLAFPDTLFYPAVFEFASSLVAAFLSTKVGVFVDRSPRLHAVKICLFIQNFSVALTCVSLRFLQLRHDAGCSQTELIGWFGLVIFCGSVAKLASTGTKIAIGKDWAVVVSMNDAKKQSLLNAHLRRADLIAAIVAPLVYGGMITLSERAQWDAMFVGLFSIGVWNLLSLPLEYSVLLMVYKRVPRLTHKIVKTEEKQQKKSNFFVDTFEGWVAFSKEKIALASLALSFLHLTVLQPGVLMTGYLKTQGLDEASLGIFRGVASIAGVLLTFMAPYVINRFGVSRAGLIFLWQDFASLFIAFLFFLAGAETWKIVCFLTFLVLSRFGLYGFDLAEVQIMQSVEEVNK